MDREFTHTSFDSSSMSYHNPNVDTSKSKSEKADRILHQGQREQKSIQSMYAELELLEAELENFEEDNLESVPEVERPRFRHFRNHLYQEVERITEMLSALDYLNDDADEGRRQKSKIRTALTELRLHLTMAEISFHIDDDVPLAKDVTRFS